MEQHKVLLVIVSASLFFAAALGVGLWLFYPRAPVGGSSQVASATAGTQSAAGTNGTAGTQTTGKEAKSSFDPIEYLRHGNPTAQQLPQGSDNGNVIIVYGDGKSTGSSGASAGAPATGSSSATGSQGGLGALAVPPAASSTGGNTPAAGNQSALGALAIPPANASGNAATPVVPPAHQAPAPRTASSKPRVAAAPTAAQRAHQEAVQRQFWVQLLSSIHRTTAEQAQQDLQRKYSLNTLITTVTIGDRDYYRLRVGPYSSMQEAEKFQAWLKVLKDYKGAFISEVYVH